MNDDFISKIEQLLQVIVGTEKSILNQLSERVINLEHQENRNSERGIEHEKRISNLEKIVYIGIGIIVTTQFAIGIIIALKL